MPTKKSKRPVRRSVRKTHNMRAHRTTRKAPSSTIKRPFTKTRKTHSNPSKHQIRRKRPINRGPSKTIIRKTRARKPKRIQISAPNSYNEMLALNIGSKSDKKDINPYSLSMYSLMINATQANRVEAYRTGMSMGRLIYSLRARSSDITLGDSMRHLTDFFESAGHRYMTYSIHPHQITFQISNDDEMDIRLNTHVFESGILSGFVSSALHNHINVHEEKCRHHGYKVCTFVSHTRPEMGTTVSDDEVIRFVDHLKNNYKSKRQNMSHIYSLMMMSMLKDKVFSAHACSVADMIGKELRRSSIFATNQTDYILDGIRLLGIGTPSIRNNHISVRMRKTTSRMEVVKLVASMVGGLLGRYPINADITVHDGVYTVRFER